MNMEVVITCIRYKAEKEKVKLRPAWATSNMQDFFFDK